MGKLREKCYNIRHGFMNLWRWRKIVWRDRDWDSAYIAYFVAKKLSIMRRRPYTEMIMDAEWWVNYLRIAGTLADRYCESGGSDDKAARVMYSIISKRGGYWWD